MTWIKICGLTRAEDLEVALAAGADAVGFIREPSSPRYISLDWIARYAAMAGPFCTSVAVYGPPREEEVPTVAIQSLGSPPAHRVRIQVVRLTGLDDVPTDSDADALFLDAHVSGAYGGTGRKVDWNLAATVVQASAKPVILAGGLTPDNVAEAIALVRPYAVDVSSGVESAPGIKDAHKIRDFIAAVRATG